MPYLQTSSSRHCVESYASTTMTEAGVALDKALSSVSRRIVFFHPDLGIGGAERLIVDAAVGLQQRGHKVTIFTSHCDPRHCFEEARNGMWASFGALPIELRIDRITFRRHPGRPSSRQLDLSSDDTEQIPYCPCDLATDTPCIGHSFLR